MPLYEPLVDVASETGASGGSAASASGSAGINEHFSDESRQERMQLAMMEVLDGACARGRSLKYWENLKLNPIHVQMLLMKAAGFTNNKIAEQLGYTASRVSIITNHPDAMYLLSQLVSFQAEGLLDVKARIQAHAGEALDTVLMAMRTAPEVAVRANIGFKLLDRAGYGAVEKKEVVTRFEMPAAAAQALSGILQEASDLDEMVEADFEVLEGRAGETGNSLSDSEEGQGAPPALGQHEPLRRTA